jgi:RsiW-degrading membrane proteinase PrsW (M82 family)
MSSKPPATPSSVSLPARLLWSVGLPTTFAGLVYYSPPTAALTPVLLSPTILAAWQYRRLPREKSGSAEVATWTYVGISVLGPLVAGALQLSLITVMFKALFGAREGDYMRELQRVTLEDVPTAIIEARKQMAWTPNYFAALAIFSYLEAGAVEEGIKYVALRLAVLRARPKHEYEYLVYAAMAGLGYATIENIVFTHATIMKEETAAMIGLTLFERVVFASIGHTIMALLTGLQSIRRDARGEKLLIWRVIKRAVLYHGTWDFALFSLSAWNGNVGWIHPTDVKSLILGFSPVIVLQGYAVWDFITQVKQLRLRPCEQS